MSKPHPHADLMALYAQDAAETETPWDRWELKELSDVAWAQCAKNPLWRVATEYRRKPKTITVNGFEVPAPLKSAAELQKLWVASPVHPAFAWGLTFGSSMEIDSMLLARGLLHATEEAAVAHAKAMLGIDPEGSEA